MKAFSKRFFVCVFDVFSMCMCSECHSASLSLKRRKTTSTSPPYVKQGSQRLVVSTTWNTLSSGVASPKEEERSGLCYQNGYRHKADRNAAASK